MPQGEHKPLQRLNDCFFRGRSYVLWSQTIENRETGWLTESHHGLLREVLFIHALGIIWFVPTTASCQSMRTFYWSG